MYWKHVRWPCSSQLLLCPILVTERWNWLENRGTRRFWHDADEQVYDRRVPHIGLLHVYDIHQVRGYLEKSEHFVQIWKIDIHLETEREVNKCHCHWWYQRDADICPATQIFEPLSVITIFIPSETLWWPFAFSFVSQARFNGIVSSCASMRDFHPSGHKRSKVSRFS